MSVIHYLLASVTSHKEAINRIKNPLYVMNYFPLAVSKSLIYLAFVELLGCAGSCFSSNFEIF